MAVFKCKMCGGDLEANEELTVGTCSYCDSTMTLPKASDDKKVNMFNRANHFRRNNDFDKAMAAYESILNEDSTDAEAHWGVVLCKYGIEYVEDPITYERIPTCHRTQFDSIFIDPDYKEAIANADYSAQIIYETEAKRIDEIQKKILEISAKEEPFDVFICYKEASESGVRTQDSVIAQDIYYQLKQEGFKVFFSRLTLEDKLGKAYEPYIFAALNSSKVMVAVGTKPEYFNALWVKNEWNRYLALIKKGERKTLIPAYRDMDAYDLPEEFSNLQAQDMSKIGFIQDLIRGIKKLVQETTEKASIASNSAFTVSAGSVEPLLRRASLLLEDGEFAKADELLEQVLNQSPEDARAYIYKLMIELKVKTENQLANSERPLTEYNNFNKAIRFADTKQKEEYSSYNRKIIEKTDKVNLGKYNYAVDLLNNCEYSKALPLFYELGDYRDCKVKYNKYRMFGLKQGDIITFGKYIQRSETNDADQIKWVVLSISENRALLISEKCLDCKPYNSMQTQDSWDSSSIRNWLNNSFLNSAFTLEEQNNILSTVVKNENTTETETSTERNIEDKIFLLSFEETNIYFKNDILMQAKSTQFAEEQGTYVGKDGNSIWWLRNADEELQYCGYVDDDNYGYEYIEDIDFNTPLGIRPAFWLNLIS